MNIDAGHIKDLQIFMAVVDAHGIANAQSVLNRDASTISRAISSLETRLGLRLCERGRHGFSLTPEGERVVAETNKLFYSLRTFAQGIEGLGGKGVGTLTIGFIDNIISDPACPLTPVMRELTQAFNGELSVDLRVNNPYELEKGILEKRLDLALGIFENHHAALDYWPLYREQDALYAAADHPLAKAYLAKPDSRGWLALLREQNFAARSFFNQTDIDALGFRPNGQVSFTADIEAIAFLLLSGNYIGFLPCHYAATWVDRGQLVAIDFPQLSRTSTLELAYRKGEQRPVVLRALEAFKGSKR